MNKPSFKRNNKRSKSSNKKRTVPQNLWRKWRIALVVMVGYSLMQYVNDGAVSWPGDMVKTVTEQLGDYAGRPDAGWRKATDKAEEMGVAKEGRPPRDFDLTGRVVRIADGDTVSILDRSNKQHKVRLYGIDTPERDQPHGSNARRALEGLVDNKQVGVIIVEKDDYGRTVGTLYQGDTNINATMILNGHAWWYRHYAPHNRLFADAEREAKEKGLGLWSQNNPTAPWDWRRSQR
ncbi:MAG: endonuclease YncB(thermonuclease family) [Halioglobus sp.]|jgi:endonuclease YncB( thermonuclease family)